MPEWSYALALFTVFSGHSHFSSDVLVIALVVIAVFFIRQAKLLQKLPDLLQDPENTWRFP